MIQAPTPTQVCEALAEGIIDDLRLLEIQSLRITDVNEIGEVIEWLYDAEVKSRNLSVTLNRIIDQSGSEVKP